MSFSQHKNITSGDLVVFYLTPSIMTSVLIQDNGQLNSVYGLFKHVDLIGRPFGSKWISSNGKSKAFALRPTPNLWTKLLPHRTQIIYMADASFIITALGLKPGSVVVECGTGSGSLSHHFLEAILPNGHLYTFEFNEERASLALKEFISHGYTKELVTLFSGVWPIGEGVIGKYCHRRFFVVFLDLPNPWDAIQHAKLCLSKSGGKICTFSPCVDQVQRTIIEMRKNNFTNIWMVEILVKEHQITKTGHILLSYPFSEIKGHTSYLTFATLPIN